MVGTHHASGDLGWMRLATPVWGFLEQRLDRRIAVSEQARASAQRWLPGEYEIVPNGVLIPDGVEPGGREHRVVFAGRQEPRKGLHVLLRAWPEVRRRTGATLRIAGADPLAVRLLLARLRVPDEGIDVLGFLSQDELTAELSSAKALVAPSLGGESFGMVLTRAFACATPVVASDIPGYRDVMTPDTAMAVPAGDVEALAAAVSGLLEDEPRREALGAAARELAVDRYSWADIARRLVAIYEAAGGRRDERPGGRRVSLVPRSPWLRGGLVLPFFAAVVVLLWWRGPDWNLVRHAFDLVNWAWIGFALLLNLVSVLFRSFAWRLTIDQALDPPRPRFDQIFSAFSIGLLANAILPGRIGELARVGGAAPPRAAGPGDRGHARRHRVRAPALRSLPGAHPRRLRDRDREDPALGGDEPRDRLGVGDAALHGRGRGRPPAAPDEPRRRSSSSAAAGDGPARALRASLAAAGPGRDPAPVRGMVDAAARRLRRDAGLRHPRAAAGCWRSSCS